MLPLQWPRPIKSKSYHSFYLIANYFPKFMVKEWRKSVEYFQRYSMLHSFFHATHLPPEKGRQGCEATPYRLKRFLYSQTSSIIICKHIGKCWVISEIRSTSCFPFYLKKGRNLIKNCGYKADVYWPRWRRILTAYEMFDYLLPSARFNVESFLKTYPRVKNEHFLNVDQDLHFQGHPIVH